MRHPIRAIVAGYDSFIIRLYSRIRFIILRQVFLEEIDQYLPKRGRVLDIGCGFGLFSLFFGAVAPDRRLLGVDRNAKRIGHARSTGAKLGLSNVRYEVGDATDWTANESFDAIYVLDLLHHLPTDGVEQFLAELRQGLGPGGVLLVKEVEDRPRWKAWFTLLLDRLMVGLSEPVHYWSVAELRPKIEALGFEVKVHRMRDVLPYPHVLYVCRLPGG